jgi:transcriptional regulator with XRE-family HTH domain
MFGNIIKAKRLELKLSLNQVAAEVESHKGYISGMENGKCRPPMPKVVKRLAKALDLPYQDLLAMSVIEKLPKEMDRKILADFLMR